MDRMNRISQDKQDFVKLFLNPVNLEKSCKSCPFEALTLIRNMPGNRLRP